MDLVNEILSNLRLTTENLTETNVKAKQLIQDIASALEQNETSTKWFKEMDVVSPITTEDMVLALDICNSEFNESTQGSPDVSIETIAKRCLQAEVYIHRQDFNCALEIAEETVKLIRMYHGYDAEEYRIGFHYVVDCLIIDAKIKIMMTKMAEQIDVSQLEGYLKDVKQSETFGTKEHVAVLAIKQYFCGNLRKSDYNLQIETIEKVCIFLRFLFSFLVWRIPSL